MTDLTVTSDDVPPRVAAATVPVNGQPVTLAELVEHEAMSYRAWSTPEGDFLASHLERLAQLVRWTGATSPQEHEERMEVCDVDLRARWFDRGYEQGLETARNSLGRIPNDGY